MATCLTSRAEVEARLGRTLDSEEDARFDSACADVSAYLRIIAPRIPVDQPYPDAVVGVASALVIDVLAAPAGAGAVQSEALGGYSVTYRGSGDGMTLADGYLQLLAPWRKLRLGSVTYSPTTAVVKGAL